MAIDIEHENTRQLKLWGLGLEKTIEKCVLCGGPTRYWSKEVNKPVCRACAKDHDINEVKNAKGTS